MKMNHILMFFSDHAKKIYIGLLAVMVIFALINVFAGLGNQRVNSWDEARHGVSACEMIDEGNYIVNTYNGSPDYWNAKPVFAFYGDMAGILLFGKNIFAFRFCSALCYLLIAAGIFLLLKQEIGWISALFGTSVFLVSPTNWFHCFTTGDPDALFLLFGFFSFFTLWKSAKNGWLLVPTALFLSFAFLTKSFHVASFGLAAVVFVVCYIRKYKWYHLAAAVVAGLLPVMIWAFFRYQADGISFFQNMVERDLLGRISEDNAFCEHRSSPWYQYLLVINHYMVVIPVGMILMAMIAGISFRGKQWMPDAMKPLFCWSFGIFCGVISLFSFCKVKLEWYIWPAFLFFAIAAGIVCQTMLLWLKEAGQDDWNKKYYLYPVAALLIGMIVWICIGEGKAFRENLNRKNLQQDVFCFRQGGDGFRHKIFYSMDFNERLRLPGQNLMLLIRFLDGQVLMKSMDEFKQDTQNEYLICCFDEYGDGDQLQGAQAFADKHSLELVRFAGSHGLFRYRP